MPSMQYRIILPKYDNEGHRIDTDVLRDFSKEVAQEFGGVTVTPTILGCFIGDDGSLQCEENMMIEASSSEPDVDETLRQRFFMHQLADRSGEILGQETIMMQEESDTKTTFLPTPGRTERPPVSRDMIESDFFKRLID